MSHKDNQRWGKPVEIVTTQAYSEETSKKSKYLKMSNSLRYSACSDNNRIKTDLRQPWWDENSEAQNLSFAATLTHSLYS